MDDWYQSQALLVTISAPMLINIPGSLIIPVTDSESLSPSTVVYDSALDFSQK